MPTRTDDLVEIQQLLARYAVTITQGDIDGLVGVFTPDGTYRAFGDHFRDPVQGAGVAERAVCSVRCGHADQSVGVSLRGGHRVPAQQLLQLCQVASSAWQKPC